MQFYKVILFHRVSISFAPSIKQVLEPSGWRKKTPTPEIPLLGSQVKSMGSVATREGFKSLLEL